MDATLKQFGLPAVAGSTAVLFSHPLELVKSRLQLDNELRARGAPSRYAGWYDCVRTSWARGGARYLWRGVQFGVAREFVFNSARIGSFDVFRVALADSPPLLAGFASGALGACVANPVEVLKVRAQALGGLAGHQHVGTAGLVSALRRVARAQGARALATTGLGTSTVRGALGPGTQLPAYYELKRRCRQAGFEGPLVHGLCSAASAAASVVFCNPADVVRTRLYNQPPGKARYRHASDAVAKILATEGPRGFYKGALSHYARLGPHLVLVFLVLERLRLAV